MRRLVPYALGVLMLVALLAPAAHAAKTNIRFKPVGSAVGPVAAGERYAAYQVTPGTVRVLDPLTGGRADVEQAFGCELAAVGGPQVLSNCFKPLPHARVYDIEADSAREPELDPWSDVTRNFSAVGKRWIAGTATGPGYTDASFYVDWRTGERRPASSLGAASYADLDSAALRRPLCSPLRRPRSGSFDLERLDPFGDPFEQYQYDRPYGMRRIFNGEQFFLELERCGQRKRQPVTRRPFASENLLAGKVTFAKPGSVHAFLPRSGRRFKWAVTRIDRRGERSADVAHTANRIFVSIPATSGPVWRIYSAPWPR